MTDSAQPLLSVARLRELAGRVEAPTASIEENLEAGLRLRQCADLLDGMQCPASFTDRGDQHCTYVCVLAVGHIGAHTDREGAEWTGAPFYDLDNING